MTSPDPRPLLLGLSWFPGPGGGLDRYFQDLVVSLGADGAPPPTAVIVGPAPGAPAGVVAVSDVDAPMASRLLGMVRGTRAAARDVDMIDAHFAFYAALTRLFPSVRRLPLVVHFQGPWAEESQASGEHSRWRIAAKKAVELSVYRHASHFIALSGAFKQILVERYGIDPWRISVKAPGVDLQRFTPGDKAEARRRLGLDADAWIVLTVRRLVLRTGVDVLVDAWCSFEDPNALLLIPSKGAVRPDLEAQAERLGIANRVRFLGFVDDETLIDCYRAADVSVVPTTALEGFGMVVLESLACGLPLITSDSGGLAEAVAPLDPSLLFPAGDPVALATRLEAAREPGSLPSAERCRAYAERFSWPSIAEWHRRFYAKAVSTAEDRPPLRVVYVDHTAALSGAELSMLRQIPAIDGIDPHMIIATDGPLVPRLLAAGVSVEVMPMGDGTRLLGRERVQMGRLPARSALGAAWYTLRLARRLRKLKPDVVHTCSLKSAMYGAAAARLARVPVVWEVQDRIADDYLPASTVRFVRAVARRLPNAIIANSEATASTLPGLRRPPTVIPLPVPEPSSQRPPGQDGNRPLRVGIVGRLSPWKGQDLFLRAFAKAFPDGDQRAVIIGAAQFGEHEVETGLRALATELDIDDRVEMRGHRDDVESELRQLDVLVHASTIPEPFGMVVTEGMAMGLPVLAADAGGPVEIIHDGVDGIRYRMGDADALAAAMQRVAADEDLRNRLGEAARVRARDFYPEALGDRYLDVYRSVARR